MELELEVEVLRDPRQLKRNQKEVLEVEEVVEVVVVVVVEEEEEEEEEENAALQFVPMD